MHNLEYIIRIKIHDSALSDFITQPLCSLKEFEFSCIQQVLDYYDITKPVLTSYTSSIEHDYTADIDQYSLLIYATIDFTELYRMYLTDEKKSIEFIDSSKMIGDIELDNLSVSIIDKRL